jgi:hypothetical protein
VAGRDFVICMLQTLYSRDSGEWPYGRRDHGLDDAPHLQRKNSKAFKVATPRHAGNFGHK